MKSTINLSKSEDLYNRALHLAPAGVHSPVRAFRAVGGNPVFFKKGQGSQLWDVDGNQYTDFCMSWGALALGHAHPKVMQAIHNQVENGTHYGTPTELDVELAEEALKYLKPFDRIRFVNSGTEAVMTAVRLARGYTGKNKILKVEGSYHGHVDSLLVAAGSGVVTQGNTNSAGVPEGCVQDTLVIPYNQPQALEQAFAQFGNQIAAIILEPIMANNGLFEIGSEYFKLCRKLCDAHKSLLIFDEVITGFRVHAGGAKALYDAKPDIGTYGKVIGGGMPIGAIAARAEIMNHLAPLGPVYQAGTLSGNPIAMASGLASLKALHNEGFYQYCEEIGQHLDQLMLNLKTKTPFAYRRIGSIFWVCPGSSQMPAGPDFINANNKEAYKTNFHHLLEHGFYTAPSVYEVGFLSLAHKKSDLDSFAQALSKL